MTAYVLIAAILAFLALATVAKPSLNTPAIVVATVLLALFSGLRYQTGYDWPAYEAYFETVRTVSQICAGVKNEVKLLVEPLYEALNFFVKQAGGTVWTVFFISAAFNMVAIAYVCWRIAPASVLPSLIAYYGFAYLIGQFSIVRQGIGSSVVLLALLLTARKKYAKSGVLFVAAAGFHVSTVLLSPVILLSRHLPSRKMIVAFILGGVVFMFLKLDPIKPIAWVATEYGPRWIAAKAQFYGAIAPASISVGSAGMIAFHVVFLALAYFSTSKAERDDRYVRVGVWLCLATLAAHLYFAAFPSFWNRFMMVSIPWEVATLYRLEWVRSRPRWVHAGAITGLSFSSTAALVMMLSKPAYLPFTPYHSLIHVWVGNEGDGRSRIDTAILSFNEFTHKLPDKRRRSLASDDDSQNPLCFYFGATLAAKD